MHRRDGTTRFTGSAAERGRLDLPPLGVDGNQRRGSAADCPCGCGYGLTDREAMLADQRHSELVFQGLPPLPSFVPGVGHV